MFKTFVSLLSGHAWYIQADCYTVTFFVLSLFKLFYTPENKNFHIHCDESHKSVLYIRNIMYLWKVKVHEARHNTV
jgi:hypothetical protein